MIDSDRLREARAVAALLLAEGGYAAEAKLAAAGEGDDFVEVRIALALIPMLEQRRTTSPAVMRSGRRLVGEEC